MVLFGILVTAALGVAAQPAGAIHQGATLDCGSAGTFTLHATSTGAGLFPPSFIQVDLLEQDGKRAGTLIPFAISINGQPLDLVTTAAPAALAGSVGMATCSFTASNGDYVVLTGLLNIP